MVKVTLIMEHNKTITTFSGLIDTIPEWKSKRLSNEKFTSPYIANVSVSPKLVWMKYSRIRLKFKGSSLKLLDKKKIKHLLLQTMW